MSTAPTPTQRIHAAFRLDRAVRMVWKTAPRWTATNAVLVVVQGGLPLAGLFVMQRILNAIAAAVAAPGDAAAVQDVWMWVGVTSGVGLLSAVTRLVGEYAAEAQALQVTDGIAEILHAQSAAVDLAYYEDPAYYDTLHRAQREAPDRPARIVNGLIHTAQSSIALIGIAVWLISLNWLLGVLLVIGVLPGAWVRLVFSRRLYTLQQAQTEHERRAWYCHEVLTDATHAKELRLFNLSAFFQSRHRALREAIRVGTLALARHRAMADLFTQGLTTVVVAASVAWIAMQAIGGRISLADVAVYYLGFLAGLSFLQSVVRSLAGLYEDNLFLTNLYAFLDITPTITARRHPAPERPPGVPAMTRGIVFNDVTFRYPTHDDDAVRQINLTIAPGEVVALVGENGSGKTTLAALLCRLYDPTHGTITVDGIDVRDLDPVQWRRRMTVAFQDFVRYALTARENVWLGDVEAEPDDGRVAEAVRRAGADSVIHRLPHGYESSLGRRFTGGQELSGGEWQSVAMARAFFREADLVILDEPSSALDALAEANLLRELRHLLAGRSALVISHRLSAIQMADRIYVLDRGTIVEHGTHDALMAQDGHYARLYRAQAGHYTGHHTGGRP